MGAARRRAGHGGGRAPTSAPLFQARWQDEALDDAFPFYDAGAVAVLGLQRA